MAKIYLITNNLNGKKYVGKSLYSLEKRFAEHCNDAFRRVTEQRPLYAAMRKYGVENFSISLLEETDDPDEREQYWIHTLDTYHNGYNATLGGEGKPLYDHDAILARLKEYPHTATVAKEFGCCKDIVYEIAKENDIKTINLSSAKLSKAISQYSLDN